VIAADTTLDATTPAAIIYTSGTTGAAKGAVITHGALAANARNLVDAWRITATDRFLLALPLFHVHGLGNGIHSWLLSGCRTRLLERFDHRSAAATFLDFRPTLFFGVPTMYVRMLEIDESAARAIGGALRLCVSGSAPLPAQVLEEFDARFGQRILERYGMTETLMTLGNLYDGERRAGTVGQPFAGVTARIATETDDAPVGVPGELLVQSPTLFAGYWNRPDATAAAFRDGWFATATSPNDPRTATTHSGPEERSDHLGRLQYLPARDRRGARRPSRRRRGRSRGQADRLKGEVRSRSS
jgi:malonyl-CoA/methylmalonyl-CoA synthetase